MFYTVSSDCSAAACEMFTGLLCGQNIASKNVTVTFLHQQVVSEKHKINVPETMNEFLDMSDDEGMLKCFNMLYYYTMTFPL